MKFKLVIINAIFTSLWTPVHVQLNALLSGNYAGVYISFKDVFKCHNDLKRDRCSFDINVHICDTFAAGYAHMCICIYMRICMHTYMDAYVRL